MECPVAAKFDWDQFVLRVDDTTAVVPCLQFVLYLDATDAAGISQFYQRALEALGPRLTHVKAESKTRRSAITPKALTMVPTWLQRPKQDKGYHVEFSGCDGKQGVSASALELYLQHRPTANLSPDEAARRKAHWKVLYEEQGWKSTPHASVLRVTFPLDHPLAREPAALVDWALGL